MQAVVHSQMEEDSRWSHATARRASTAFSVVVPAYNAQETLAGTLQALVKQTFDDWECIVVDDGSVDETGVVAASFAEQDERFRVIAQANRGTGGAYNTGVTAASGDWVTVCSADDVLLPSHLCAMQRPSRPTPRATSCPATATTGEAMTQGSLCTRVPVHVPLGLGRSRTPSIDSFFSVGACYRRSLFDALGGYREEIYGEDYDFWLRALAAGARHRYVPETLTRHRVSDTQKSADRVRAYESDIRSISNVLQSAELTESEQRAAHAAISAPASSHIGGRAPG